MQKRSTLNIISIILWGILALASLKSSIPYIIDFVSYPEYYLSESYEFFVLILSTIRTIILLAICVYFIKNHLNKSIVIFIGALALLYLIAFINTTLIYNYLYFSDFLEFAHFIAFLLSAIVAFFTLTNNFVQYQRICKSIWVIPGCIAMLYLFTDTIVLWLEYDFSFSRFFYQIFYIGAIFCLTASTVFPDGKISFGSLSTEHKSSYESAGNTASNPYGYHDTVVHVLLLIFTFGIWYLIWIYKTTNFLNCMKNEKMRNATVELLLCAFIPFYAIYWTYKSAQRIDKLSKVYCPEESEITNICLILAFFIGFVPPIIMQDKLNHVIISKEKNPNPTASETFETVSQATRAKKSETISELGIADELKKYKELFDEDVITQEEFDAKKQQLLNL